VITREEGRVRIAGPLTLETAKALYEGGLQPGGESALEVDLSQVEAVDSAAVSLLLAWLREAQRNKVSLSFSHVPDNLLSLARLYGVADMLPLQPDAAGRT
jgi:phospholipid transport system transporter-binding protein